ncbi:hypothetical protein ACFE04_007533 [Oxalis oulophora]
MASLNIHQFSSRWTDHAPELSHHQSSYKLPVLDPRSKRVKKWNQALVISRWISLAIDPFFFYLISFSTINNNGQSGSTSGSTTLCVYVERDFAITITALRTCVDAVHLFHMWIQSRLAYVSEQSMVIGCGTLVWDPHSIWSHYVASRDGLWFDVFVVLPVLQVVFWLAVPKLIREGHHYGSPMTILALFYLFQLIPKVVHCVCLTRKSRKITGFVFGSIWWNFFLNLFAYLIAAHMIGDEYKGSFVYGIFSYALPVISLNSIALRILYPIYWGLTSLSSWGNVLSPSSNILEVILSTGMVVAGLLLFTVACGNIQVFLAVILAKGKKVQLKRQEFDWWMKRRQLPPKLRQRVRLHERQECKTVEAYLEMEWIEELPDGLRMDIKRFLCLDLVRKVPLFHNLGDLVLDNICDKVKPLMFSKDEKIIREGDLVQNLVFIVQGQVKRSQKLSRGMVSTSILHPGGFLGDELLSWSLRRPFMERLPVSSATFTCVETVEAFILGADLLRYITDSFRCEFVNPRIKQITRYYSTNWRSWAARQIQGTWRGYVMRRKGHARGVDIQERLKQYAAAFMSFKPHDHLE